MGELAVVGEFAVSGASWFWLFVPMPLLIVLCITTLFTERRD